MFSTPCRGRSWSTLFVMSEGPFSHDAGHMSNCVDSDQRAPRVLLFEEYYNIITMRRSSASRGLTYHLIDTHFGKVYFWKHRKLTLTLDTRITFLPTLNKIEALWKWKQRRNLANENLFGGLRAKHLLLGNNCFIFHYVFKTIQKFKFWFSKNDKFLSKYRKWCNNPLV